MSNLDKLKELAKKGGFGHFDLQEFMAAVTPGDVTALFERLEAAEEDLARRDATEREPFKYCCENQGNPDWTGIDYDLYDHEHEAMEKSRDCFNASVYPVYRAAPPAPNVPVKLPDNLLPYPSNVERQLGYASGWNECITEVMRLNNAGGES